MALRGLSIGSLTLPMFIQKEFVHILLYGTNTALKNTSAIVNTSKQVLSALRRQ